MVKMGYVAVLEKLTEKEKEEIRHHLSKVKSTLKPSKSSMNWLVDKFNALFDQKLSITCGDCRATVRTFFMNHI
jgi:F0F1-type ATP synthase delta subunit